MEQPIEQPIEQPMEQPMEQPIDPLVADMVDALDAALREEFEERAAIIEFDGKQQRSHAECLALIDILRRHPAALTGVAFSVFQFSKFLGFHPLPVTPPGYPVVASWLAVAAHPTFNASPETQFWRSGEALNTDQSMESGLRTAAYPFLTHFSGPFLPISHISSTTLFQGRGSFAYRIRVSLFHLPA